MASAAPASLGVALYRLLLKAARECQVARVPLVGVVGFDSQPPVLDLRRHLAARFRASHSGAVAAAAGRPPAAAAAAAADDAFRALRQVHAQTAVLLEVEEETREVRGAPSD